MVGLLKLYRDKQILEYHRPLACPPGGKGAVLQAIVERVKEPP